MKRITAVDTRRDEVPDQDCHCRKSIRDTSPQVGESQRSIGALLDEIRTLTAEFERNRFAMRAEHQR